MTGPFPFQSDDQDSEILTVPTFAVGDEYDAVEATAVDQCPSESEPIASTSTASALTTQVASPKEVTQKVDVAKATETRSFINSLVTAQLIEEGVKAGDIGHRIVEEFFDGDYKKALSRNGHKEFSLRDVVAEIGRDDLCKLGRSALTQNVQIAAQRNMLGCDAVAGLDRGQQLALVLVKNPVEKRRWIETARRDGLGANKLREAIGTRQQPKRPRKGKKGARQTPMSALLDRALQTFSSHPSSKAFDAFWEGVDFAKEDPADVRDFRKWSTEMIASLKRAKAKAKLVTASKAG